MVFENNKGVFQSSNGVFQSSKPDFSNKANLANLG
jgi:hypothetical protein